MKRFSYLLLGLIFISVDLITACTNFLVSKGASLDGSTMITYTADSYNMYGELYHYPAARYPEGAWLEVYEWDSGKLLGKIKQVRETYNVVGNMNEYQVVIGETTFGGREELVDPKGVVDYGSMIYIALQRSKTAREAIKIMTDLAAEYGYCSSGESFSISDPNEVWIMELVGKGPENKGAVWVAYKVPDGYVCAHANMSRITTFPLDDPENCLYAPDVISFAREKGYYTGEDENFNFSDAYAPIDFGAIRFCDGRVWSLFRRVNPEMEKYYSYICGESLERMPLFVKPVKKISIDDVMGLMRDHFEGTELDMTKGVAAGPYQMPYRWRPLVWEYDGKEYFNERPISTPQTGFSFISQSRSWLPNEVGGVLWFGLDDSYMTVYTPMYSSMVKMPFNYAVGRGSMSQFSWDSAFWVFNFVSNNVYPRYSIMVPDVIKVQNELEGSYLAKQKEIEDKALQLSRTSKRDAVEFLNNYSIELAENTITRWKKLGEQLLVKYMDGVVKDEFHKVKNVGYPEDFKKVIVSAEGEKIKMKKVQPELDREYKDHIAKAESLIKEKKYAEAKDHYKKALDIRPGNSEISEKITKLDIFINKMEELHETTF